MIKSINLMRNIVISMSTKRVQSSELGIYFEDKTSEGHTDRLWVNGG